MHERQFVIRFYAERLTGEANNASTNSVASGASARYISRPSIVHAALCATETTVSSYCNIVS